MHSKTLLGAAAALALMAGTAAAQAPAQGGAAAPKTPAQTPAQSAAQQSAPAAAAQTPAPSTAAAATSTTPKVTPKGDIVETARASGQFTTFIKAVEATNLTSVLKGNQNLTVFAPTDAAFAALPPGELERLMRDKPGLQKLLTYHVINARVDSTKIQGAKGPVTTVAGSPVELDGSGATLKANDAQIVQPDVMASNGVLHVVDKVLKPEGATAAAQAASASSATTSASSASTTAPAQTEAPKASANTNPPAQPQAPATRSTEGTPN